MAECNKVKKFNVSGGIIGMLAGDEAVKLAKVLKAENASGWRYRSHSGNTGNLLTFLIELICLTLTLLLWSPGRRYLLVLDKMD